MAWTNVAVATAVIVVLLGPHMTAADPTEVSAARACLDRNQRHAVIASGRVIKLSTAMRSVHRRIRGEVIRAQLCRRARGYFYLLTVLMRSGKVKRASVDAATGRLIGVR